MKNAHIAVVSFHRLALCFITCVLVTSCAAPLAPLEFTENLQKATSSTVPLVLGSNASYKYVGPLSKEIETGALAGTYRLEKENRMGQFYAGDTYSIWWRGPAGVAMVTGGIWIPKNLAESPRIYYKIGYPSFESRNMEDALAKRAKLMSVATPNTIDDASTSNAVTQIAIQNTPTAATPLQAGAAAGVATGLVSTLLPPPDHLIPQLYGKPLDDQFGKLIRIYFVAQ